MEEFWDILKREYCYEKCFTDRESLLTMIEEHLSYNNFTGNKKLPAGDPTGRKILYFSNKFFV